MKQLSVSYSRLARQKSLGRDARSWGKFPFHGRWRDSWKACPEIANMATPACALIYTSAWSMTAIVIIEPRCKGELNHEIKFVFSVSLFFSAHCRSPCWIIICNSQHFCATQVVRKTWRVTRELNVDNWNDNCEAKSEAKTPRPLRGLQVDSSLTRNVSYAVR